MAEKTVTEKRRFTAEDRRKAAEQIHTEWADRKKRRDDKERIWKEVDRQLRMEPDIPYKFDEKGAQIPGLEWMPEMELPLQSQTLEVLKADARRFLFPDTGPWFAVGAKVDEEYLETVDFRSLMLNKQVDPPSPNKQELANLMLRDFMEFFHRQSRFRDHWDMMNSGAFSHGTLIGRARYMTKHVTIHEAKGVVQQRRRIPQIIPLDVRHTYLDDSQHAQMREGEYVGPCNILEWWQKHDDLILAARRSRDPKDMWFGKTIANLVADKSGQIHILEHEGDLIIERNASRSFYIPNAVVTVAHGTNPPEIIRIRFNDFNSSSYIAAPYDVQDPRSPYGVGPLMKGMHIHKAASEALNRLMQWAALNVQPPVKYSPDPAFDQTGGPILAPMEQWNTMSDVEPVQIGDGAAMLNLYIHMLNQYYQLTGTQASRLGAPAKSHTTRGAAELTVEQAQLRTVDYDRTVLQGPLEQWLYFEYEMIRSLLEGDGTNDAWEFYSSSFGCWMIMPRELLPTQASFEVFGSAGPFEARRREASRLSGLQLALQIEQARRAVGMPPRLDLDSFQDHVIRSSGNTDLDQFVLRNPPGAELLPGPGAVQTAGNPAAGPAVQALSQLGVGG